MYILPATYVHLVGFLSLSSSLHDSSNIFYASLLIRCFKFSKNSTPHYVYPPPLIFTSLFILFARQSVFGSNGILNFVESNFIITRYQLCKASKSNLCDFKLVSLKVVYATSKKSLYVTVQCCAIVRCSIPHPTFFLTSSSHISSIYIIQSDFMIGKFLTPPTPYTYYPPSKFRVKLHVIFSYLFSCSSSRSSSSCSYYCSNSVLFLCTPPLPLCLSPQPTIPFPIPFLTTQISPFLLHVSLK